MALLVMVVWSIPLVSLATPVVALGPDRTPTWPTAFALLRGRWWATAGRLFILWLVVVGVGIGFSVVSGPITVASFWGGALVNTLAQAAQTVYWQVGGVAVYRWAEGPVDPRLLPGSSV